MWTGSCFFIYSTEVGQTQSAEQAYFCVLWANRDESEASERRGSRSSPRARLSPRRLGSLSPLFAQYIYIYAKKVALVLQTSVNVIVLLSITPIVYFVRSFHQICYIPKIAIGQEKLNLLFFCFMLIDITNKFTEKFLFSISGQVDQHFRTRVVRFK